MSSKVMTLRNALLGLASWALPFFASFAFYDRSGQLVIDIFLFKSIMIVFGGLVGVWLLLRAFRHTTPTFGSGLAIGLFWLLINYGFDLAILVAAMGMGPVEWFTGVGLRYLMIPIMAGAMGALAERVQLPAISSD